MEIRRYQQADHDEVWMLHKTALQDVGADLGSGPWDDDLHHIEKMDISSLRPHGSSKGSPSCSSRKAFSLEIMNC